MLGEPGFLAPQLQTAKVTTTDATATALWSYTVPTNAVVRIVATIVGRKSDGSARAAYTKIASFYRATGSAAQGGSTETIGTDYESNSAWDATIDLSTNTVRVLVTGAASTTIAWSASIEATVV